MNGGWGLNCFLGRILNGPWWWTAEALAVCQSVLTSFFFPPKCVSIFLETKILSGSSNTTTTTTTTTTTNNNNDDALVLLPDYSGPHSRPTGKFLWEAHLDIVHFPTTLFCVLFYSSFYCKCIDDQSLPAFFVPFLNAFRGPPKACCPTLSHMVASGGVSNTKRRTDKTNWERMHFLMKNWWKPTFNWMD